MRIAIEGSVSGLNAAERRILLERAPSGEPYVRRTTAAILDRVRREGDEALHELARELDGVDLDELEVPREAWDRALAALDGHVREALEHAARNVEAFHRAQVPDELVLEVEPGVTLGRRFVPLGAVGVYAPGGRAAYPSSVLMGVLPARAAGVDEVVVCSPPGHGGAPSDVVLAAAAIAGATRVFAIGGAGAIAAMAWGTESVPRCQAVVGPGNRWVAEAKRQVAGEVVIDAPAGPSELLVVAGPDADPALVAAELLAQAEHDPDAAVSLVTSSADLLSSVRAELTARVETTPRREIVEVAFATRGALLLADDLDEALAFAEAYAPEHLAILTGDPERDGRRVTTAGTVFEGASSSVAFGDYLSGANHVLPTAGASRSFSGLSSLHFMRSYTWQRISPAAAARFSGPTAALAEAEGLPAHAAAARLRGTTTPEPGTAR